MLKIIEQYNFKIIELKIHITFSSYYRFCHGFCPKNSRQNLLFIIIVAMGETHGYNDRTLSWFMEIIVLKPIFIGKP